MIASFACRRTERLFTAGKATGFLKAIESVAKRKLTMVHVAKKLDDLRIPPGNRLEALKGNHNGQHSIRIYQQYRLCFCFTDGKAEDVEIVDYHD
ncbi:Toxin HigB [hydrothermal vent metagenome]|uniref:Toxin HigB n=1 Tax=hydrothermal vent metagenome TaxID=652676 RepID=A0A3B1AB93_9ZZZZ